MAACERAHDASCEIRKRAGIRSWVEPSFYVRALYAELEARRPADELAPRRKANAFRMLKPELIELGTPAAMAELRGAVRSGPRSAARGPPSG